MDVESSDGQSRPASAWETAVGMTLLWIIPAAAFVLVLLQGGAHGR